MVYILFSFAAFYFYLFWENYSNNDSPKYDSLSQSVSFVMLCNVVYFFNS